jgi:hypothetical protein
MDGIVLTIRRKEKKRKENLRILTSVGFVVMFRKIIQKVFIVIKKELL